MDIASTVEKFTGETRKGKNSKIEPSAIDHITHDIVNHLSIICLCCCELRNSLIGKLESDQLNEFKQIDRAVQDAATKIHQLKALLQAHLPTGEDSFQEPALSRAKRDDSFQKVPARFISHR